MRPPKIYGYMSLWLIFCIAIGNSCTKLTQVPEPTNTTTTTETFSTEATATSAIVGIYNDFLNGPFGNGSNTFSLGMAADELHQFGGGSNFETNTYSANSGDVNPFWNSAYYDIYLSNAAIEALPASKGVSAQIKNQLTGEAKFFRAFFHFYLMNLFGDVPLVTTTAYHITDTLPRSPATKVYDQIIADLKDAQNLLANDYSVSGGERIRVNQAGATALLARAYLYQQKWDSAEMQASLIIENKSVYNLVSDLKDVFLANSSEAILQLQIPNKYPYATQEGDSFIPYDSTTNPSYYLSDELLSSFENNDNRKNSWVGRTNYSGQYFYYPYKYKVFVGTSGNLAEYYMVLRVAEQYLIRAEARAEQEKEEDAISDLNIIRERAGLSDLPLSLNQSQVLAAVAQERRSELFSEWGHRWLDLKRTKQVDAILSPIKITWKSFAQLYPIPAGELVNDANLTQNSGY